MPNLAGELVQASVNFEALSVSREEENIRKMEELQKTSGKVSQLTQRLMKGGEFDFDKETQFHEAFEAMKTKGLASSGKRRFKAKEVEQLKNSAQTFLSMNSQETQLLMTKVNNAMQVSSFIRKVTQETIKEQHEHSVRIISNFLIK